MRSPPHAQTGTGSIDPLASLQPGPDGHAPCACFNVRRMARAITQIYDEAVKSTGIRSTQFSLLIGISMKGEEGIGAIAEGLDTDRTTLSRNLKPLLAHGFVEEFPTDDGRVRGLRLTDQGLKVLADAVPMWTAAQKRIREGLSKAHFDALPYIADEIVSISRGE